MLQAERSRRIMLRSARTAMVSLSRFPIDRKQPGGVVEGALCLNTTQLNIGNDSRFKIMTECISLSFNKYSTKRNSAGGCGLVCVGQRSGWAD